MTQDQKQHYGERMLLLQNSYNDNSIIKRWHKVWRVIWTLHKCLKSRYKPSLPEVSVTIEAHDAERAASRDATFCLERSRVFCFHFSDAWKHPKTTMLKIHIINIIFFSMLDWFSFEKCQQTWKKFKVFKLKNHRNSHWWWHAMLQRFGSYWIWSEGRNLSRRTQILFCRNNSVQALTQTTHVRLLCRSKTVKFSLWAL